MKKYFATDLSLLCKQTFTFCLFLLCPLLCAASYYEFLQDYSIRQTPISPTWILFNIATVLYYLVHRQLKSTCRCWARVYFDVTNVLFSEACIWLSVLKFLSANPFIAVGDGCPNEPVAYEIVSIPLVVGWTIFVFIQMVLNTIIHVIVVYHVYNKNGGRMTQFTFMARASIGIFCTILQFITFFVPFLLFCRSLYGLVYSIFLLLLLITVALNFWHLRWGKEALEKNRLTNCYWKLSLGSLWVVFQFSYCFAFFLMLTVTLPFIPFNVYKIHFDGRTPEETSLNQDNTIQSYNFIPFIAWIHLFSTIREFLLKLRIEKEVIGNSISQKNVPNIDDEAPTSTLQQHYSTKC